MTGLPLTFDELAERLEAAGLLGRDALVTSITITARPGQPVTLTVTSVPPATLTGILA